MNFGKPGYIYVKNQAKVVKCKLRLTKENYGKLKLIKVQKIILRLTKLTLGNIYIIYEFIIYHPVIFLNLIFKSLEISSSFAAYAGSCLFITYHITICVFHRVRFQIYLIGSAILS